MGERKNGSCGIKSTASYPRALVLDVAIHTVRLYGALVRVSVEYLLLWLYFCVLERFVTETLGKKTSRKLERLILR